jgi:hypothetical protein
MKPALALSVSLALSLALASTAHAQAVVRPHSHRTHASMAASFYAPTRDSRQIDTVILDVLGGYEILDFGWGGIVVYAGASIVGASGFILQPNDVQQMQRFDCSVAGAGPTFLFRIEPLRLGGFSVAIDANGSLLFYTAHFPPGGDGYDFAWRIGGTLAYELSDGFRIELSSRWMHVSNGQGIGPFNPAYEGVGGSIGAQIRL